MKKYALREDVVACKIHLAIRDKCAQRLEDDGYFSMDDVLKSLGFQMMADSIRWDYVREFLEHDQGCELIPLALPFFKRRKPTDVPATYIALGRGKRTVGFASVSQANGALAIRRLDQRRAVANGASKALNTYMKALEDRHVEAPKLLEQSEVAS